ncbi:hypothetical protein ACVGXN_00010, partial [Enterobacter hormaechei]
VLALSLMGLVLGVWLRQSEGRRGRAAGTTYGSLFFTKTYNCSVPQLVTVSYKKKTPHHKKPKKTDCGFLF